MKKCDVAKFATRTDVFNRVCCKMTLNDEHESEASNKTNFSIRIKHLLELHNLS